MSYIPPILAWAVFTLVAQVLIQSIGSASIREKRHAVFQAHNIFPSTATPYKRPNLVRHMHESDKIVISTHKRMSRLVYEVIYLYTKTKHVEKFSDACKSGSGAHGIFNIATARVLIERKRWS